MNSFKKVNYVFALLLITTIYSCEYQTDEVFYRDVDKNVPMPDLTLDLNLPIEDTIYVYNNPHIKLGIKLTNKSLYGVKFYLNDEEVTDFDDKSSIYYSFRIDMLEYPEARIKAEIYTSTETGSIADGLRTESFIYETKEWTLIHSHEELSIQTEVYNGRLKLSWTPRKNSPSAEYYISTSNKLDSTYNNWYIDSNYYSSQNYISVHSNDNGSAGYWMDTEINYPYPKVHFNNRDSFLINWDKCEFYNNIYGYRVRIDSFSYELTPDDTSFVFKDGVMGQSVTVHMDILLNKYSEDNSAFDWFDNVYGYYPVSFLPNYASYSNSYFPLRGSLFYYWSYKNNKRTLFKFSLDTKTVISETVLPMNNFSISPNDKYILYEYSDYIKLASTDGYKLLKNLHESNFTSYSAGFDYNISDNGIFVYWDHTKTSLIVFDMLNERITHEIKGIDFINQYKVSAMGKYIFEPKYNFLYKLDDNSYSIVWTDNTAINTFNFAEFFPDNQEKICLYDGELFYIKNCLDFSTETSFSLNNTKIINVDFEGKKILCYDDYKYYVFSLFEGDLIEVVPTINYENAFSRIFNNCILTKYSQYIVE